MRPICVPVLAPTGALAGLVGIAYQHDEEVETVAGSIDRAMGSAADEVAIGGQELEKDGGRMGFSVRSDGADGEPCQSIKGGRPRWLISVRLHFCPGGKMQEKVLEL